MVQQHKSYSDAMKRRTSETTHGTPAIIRPINGGHDGYFTFDSVEDARGHPSTIVEVSK